LEHNILGSVFKTNDEQHIDFSFVVIPKQIARRKFMKNKIYLSLSAIVLLIGIISVSWTVSAEKASSAKQMWEYKIVTVYGTTTLPPPSLTQFNQMGDEGWELVMILPEDSTVGSSKQRKADYYFKRAK
jgi:hypothetical protein